MFVVLGLGCLLFGFVLWSVFGVLCCGFALLWLRVLLCNILGLKFVCKYMVGECCWFMLVLGLRAVVGNGGLPRRDD